MANWFAPALVVLREARPLAAMIASVRTSLRNWLPFLVYGVIGVAIVIAAAVAFALSAGAIGFEFVSVILDGIGYGSGSRSLGTLTLATVILGAVYAIANGSGHCGDIRLDLCELSRHTGRNRLAFPEASSMILN